ncbi:MAG: TOBE domain-containing protein [Dehalococcoidales bacterium]|jgi:molybdopterin-binding protein|nr:TOBE domain-containing protein [Dehalococcoidales bacterium]
MKYGARNQLSAVVKHVKKDGIMGYVDLEIPANSRMGSVMTLDSLDDLNLKAGDKVILLVKAISVLVVRED